MSDLRDNTAESQYELDENGHTSFARYRKEDGVLTILWVEAPPELRGTGAAGRLMALVADIKSAKAAGTTGAAMTAALEFQRHGQFYLDFVESENSNGFHAPQESARILGEAIDYLRQGQLALRPSHAPVATSPGQR